MEDLERRLAHAWNRVLGTSGVSLSDDLRELGADSLTVLRLVAAAEEQGLAIDPRTVWEYRTFGSLLEHVALDTDAKQTRDARGWGEGNGSFQYLPSAIQTGFLDEAGTGGGSHWYVPFLVRTPRRLDGAHCRDALLTVVGAHPAFRQRFLSARELTIDTDAAGSRLVSFDETRIDDRSWGSIRRELQERIREPSISMDLRAGPLAKAVLGQPAGSDESYLLVALHHLACDALSASIVQRQLLAVLSSAAELTEIPGVGQDNFVRWLARMQTVMLDSDLQRELPFWLNQHRSVTFPTDHHGLNSLSSEAEVECVLDADQTWQLGDTARRMHISLAELCLGAVVSVLAAYAGNQPYSFTVLDHGRLVADVSLADTVGCLVHEYPLCVELAPGARAQEAVECAATSLRRVPGQGIGYGLLRHSFSNEESALILRRESHPQVYFNFIGRLMEIAEPGDLRSSSGLGPDSSRHGGIAEHHRQPASHLTGFRVMPVSLDEECFGAPNSERREIFDIEALISRGRLRIRWIYSRNLHRPQTASALLHELRKTLLLLC